MPKPVQTHLGYDVVNVQVLELAAKVCCVMVMWKNRDEPQNAKLHANALALPNRAALPSEPQDEQNFRVCCNLKTNVHTLNAQYTHNAASC
jgi:hypothetical protein